MAALEMVDSAGATGNRTPKPSENQRAGCRDEGAGAHAPPTVLVLEDG
jgi:hypothetical protein